MDGNHEATSKQHHHHHRHQHHHQHHHQNQYQHHQRVSRTHQLTRSLANTNTNINININTNANVNVDVDFVSQNNNNNIYRQNNNAVIINNNDNRTVRSAIKLKHFNNHSKWRSRDRTAAHTIRTNVKWLHCPPTLLVFVVLLLLNVPLRALADCPHVCVCKWKSGKETAMCLNGNLTKIPLPLEASTQVLELSGNDIAVIQHDTFAAANLLNLQKVHMPRCRLRTIERFAFRKLINLVDLDFSHNQLLSIPSAAFEFTPELRELRLSGNPIQRVADNAFMHVPQLVRLELSDCRLTAVEVRAFAGLESSLEWLKLDGNRLSEVHSGTITSLMQLNGIELARNQWNCSCDLRPLRVWMLRENKPCGVPPICRNPPRLAGRSWDKLDLDDFACVPQIIATDTNAHGVEGRNVTMSCSVRGEPEPSVRWLVKNRVIANLSGGGLDGLPSTSPRMAATTQGRKTYVVNMLRNASNLTILTADMQDAGIYTCAAENKAGKVEASVTLAVSRRPPEAPFGAKIVLLCVLIAMLFVVGSSFIAICFCTLRRKRKMRLWNSVPPVRTESYEKIEMTTRGGVGGGGGGMGGTNDGDKRDAILAGVGGDAHNYLRNVTTPLNCGSDDGGDIGIAIVNPSGGSAKRNGDYRNIPTHCDDDEDGGGGGGSGVFYRNGWKGVTLRTSPHDPKRKLACATATTSASIAPTTTTTNAIANTPTAVGVEEADLHIPRLIDLSSNPDSASSSISGQVDAATRLGGGGSGSAGGGYPHLPGWTNTPIATTKINSPHSKLNGAGGGNNSGPYYGGSGGGSEDVFGSGKSNGGDDIFDSNYPDLLDIAKYAVAQAAKSSQFGGSAGLNSMSAAATTAAANGALCTLPRKLKNTGKYFKHSSDSQSPLLADNSNSSKYGSSTLGDCSFLNDVALGRRFSAESTYSTATYTTGQRANSFLSLVQSANKGGIGHGGLSTTGSGAAGHLAGATAIKRNPSLPSSPVHELHQQHQRSFSSAATPLLDFSTLATRAAGAAGSNGTAPTSNSMPPTTSSVTAYDYHAAQLERFLEEYRNLQDQLCKMKETCETIRKKEAPLRVAVGHSAQLADPVMFNAAMAASAHSPNTNPKTTMLKNKAILPGQPPDPPPYWLHRNAMLKRLNESQSDIFKS